jgi:general secretion pathway protein F/type IV pilus assembly protein PilC
MVRAGEKGGFLESSLARLAAFVQGQVELRRKVVGSAIYPASIASLGGLLILALLVFFIPQFGSLYEDVDTPLLTDVLLGASAALTSRWYVGVVVIVLAAVGVRQLLKSPAVRRRVIATLVRTPKLGPLLRDLAVARFARVLGTLLAAGVPMLQALKIARDAAGYAEVASTIDAATDAVRAGEPLATPLQESIFFEDDTVEILAVAEQANNLEEVLVTLADTLEQRVDRQLTIVVRLIEPILLLAIAGVIVLVALGLILPMLKLTSGLDV